MCKKKKRDIARNSEKKKLLDANRKKKKKKEDALVRAGRKITAKICTKNKSQQSIYDILSIYLHKRVDHTSLILNL